MALHRYFSDRDTACEITVLDITEHETWTSFTEISFIHGSAFDIDKLFEKECFDLVFVNYVLHHLVQHSYMRTIEGIRFVLASIRCLLKDHGMLCVSECYYNFLMMKELSGFLIYTASMIKFPFVIHALRKFGSKSAGVGVCFLSQDRWKALFSKMGISFISLSEEPLKRKSILFHENFFYFILKKECQ